MRLENFKLARFKIFIKPLEEIVLPRYKGSTFRGGFGNSFRRIVCLNKKWNCPECILKEKCIYYYIFETPSSLNVSFPQKNSYMSHPFVLEPPLEEKKLYTKEEKIFFHLILIGKTIEYLPYFVFVLDELGKIGLGKGRGKYFLERVENCPLTKFKGSEDIGGDNRIVYYGEKKLFYNDFNIITGKQIIELCNSLLSTDKLAIDFLTPTRIKFQGKLIPELKFSIFIKNLFRRISTLACFHSNNILDLNYAELIKEAKNVNTLDSKLSWYDWGRYSARQDTRMKLGGFKGRIIFQENKDGLLKKFLPFILLGEHTHIGKGTSFGLGQYKVINY